MTEQQVIAATRHWVDAVVVGLNFCPFAKREVVRNSIRYQVYPHGDIHGAIDLLLDEVFFLDANQEIETSLLIYPNGFESFERYLDLVDMANGILQGAGYAGTYQLATFHPDYLFEGEDSEDPSHFTNRAPYPTLHLIRESSIDRALKTYKSPDSIPQTNIDRARELGNGYFTEVLKRCLCRAGD